MKGKRISHLLGFMGFVGHAGWVYFIGPTGYGGTHRVLKAAASDRARNRYFAVGVSWLPSRRRLLSVHSFTLGADDAADVLVVLVLCFPSAGGIVLSAIRKAEQDKNLVHGMPRPKAINPSSLCSCSLWHFPVPPKLRQSSSGRFPPPPLPRKKKKRMSPVPRLLICSLAFLALAPQGMN